MKPYTTYIALLVFLFLATSCRESGEKAGDMAQPSLPGDRILITQTQFEANDMALGTPEKRTFPEVIRVSGVIDVPPENRVVISAIYGGFVRKISLLEGDQVRKGQAVVTLENPEFLQLQQDFLEVREQLPYLKSEYERQQTLFGEKISSEKVFLKARSDYLTALAQQKSLQAQLQQLGISAEGLGEGALRPVISMHTPISGKVARVNVRRGAYVSPATEIMEIINNEHVHLELKVFEQDINRIRVGQTIRYQIPEVSNLDREGVVHLVGSNVDEKRTVKVHGHVRDEDLKELMVGMFVQADILTGPQDAVSGDLPTFWALPEGAVISDESGSYILVLETTDAQGHTFRKEPVETGVTSGGFTALTDRGTLGPSDRVLVRGAFQAAGL